MLLASNISMSKMNSVSSQVRCLLLFLGALITALCFNLPAEAGNGPNLIKDNECEVSGRELLNRFLMGLSPQERKNFKAKKAARTDTAREADLIRDSYAKLTPEQKQKYELVQVGQKVFMRLKSSHLRHIRPPQWMNADPQMIAVNGNSIRYDRRSKLINYLDQIDEHTLSFSAMAYDLEDDRTQLLVHQPKVNVLEAGPLTEKYHILQAIADSYSGFKGLVVENIPKASKINTPFRIYIASGTETFGPSGVDYRDWASDILLSRPQFVSDAALLMVKEAAQYVASGQGEVIFTGQSLGGMVAQGLGFLTQIRANQLQPDPRKRGLIHVVSWGTSAGIEPIAEMILEAKKGNSRGFPQRLEKHWSQVSPLTVAALEVWKKIEVDLRGVKFNNLAEGIRQISEQMRVIGFFFSVDPFSRIGTFLGTSFVIPYEYLAPPSCDPMKLENIGGVSMVEVGIALESHLVKSFRRGLDRNGLIAAKPALAKKWNTVMSVIDLLSPLGELWLYDLYLTKLGKSQDNWNQCFKSAEWQTNLNTSCSEKYWHGCSASSNAITDFVSQIPSYCMVKKKY